jgi:hypothetical protein
MGSGIFAWGQGIDGQLGTGDSNSRVMSARLLRREPSARISMGVGGKAGLREVLAHAPISGASMNPARSLAPDLLRGDLATTWIILSGRLQER